MAVVVPCRNKQDTIYEVLESVINQSYRPLKIVVTDDYSTDRSLDEIIRFAKDYFGGVTCVKVSENEEICRGNVKYHDTEFILVKHLKENLGKSKSLNAMISMIDEEYELVATIDADTKLDREWIWNSLKYHKDLDVAATFGWVRLWDDKSCGLLKSVRRFEYNFLLPIYREVMNPRSHWTMSGSNILYKTSIVKKFPIPEHLKENAGEDLLHTVILQSMGYKVIFVSEALAYSKEELDFGSFVKQSRRWFKGTWYVLFNTVFNDKNLEGNLTFLHRLQIGSVFIMPYYYFILDFASMYELITLNISILIWPFIDFLIYFVLSLVGYYKNRKYLEKTNLVELIKLYPQYYFLRQMLLIPYFISLKDYINIKKSNNLITYT